MAKSVFTNGTTLYSNKFSALSFVWANDGLLLKFAPVFPQMRGKTPVKGEKVYDYDNAVNFMVTPSDSIALGDCLRQLHTILANEESIRSVSYTRGDKATNGTEFTFFLPNSIKVGGNVNENILLKVASYKDGTLEKAGYHEFEMTHFTMESKDRETLSDVNVQSSLMVFSAIIEEAPILLSGIYEHGARMGNRFGTSSANAPSRAAQMEEEDVDSNAAKAAAAAVEKEFGDDDI